VNATLGMSVSAEAVRAVCLKGGQLLWVGSTRYVGADGLSEAIAGLTKECPLVPGRTRVVLDRSIVQLRSIHPAPPIKSRSVERYVELESPRLFRRNGTPWVTDAAMLQVTSLGRVLWVAGAPSDIVCAVVESCRNAGMALQGLGPAAEVLPLALANAPKHGEVAFSNGSGSEVVSLDGARTWRSRWVRNRDPTHTAWAEPLSQLKDEAPLFAAAYGAAVKVPRLLLLPEDTRAARRRVKRTRVGAVTILAIVVWLAAAGVYAGRLATAARSAERGMALIAADVDSALALRRELLAARSALNTVVAAERGRSRNLVFLAQLSTALGDSVYLVSMRISADSTLRLSGFAKTAARVLADLEQVPEMMNARFETPVTREVLGRGLERVEWDRFSVVSRLERRP
jgi:hypothetical protein